MAASERPSRLRRGTRDLWLALAVGITVTALVGGFVEHRSATRATGKSASLASADPGTAAAQAPFTVRIPRIGVSASLQRLSVTADGSLAVPRNPEQVGWWAADGNLNFVPGPTVLVGHRDSRTGPAAFYAAPSLLRGELIRVTDGRGKVHDFLVDRVERHSREAFPTWAVYAPTPGPSLRLLTCGGVFTPGEGYADNWVVFANAA